VAVASDMTIDRGQREDSCELLRPMLREGESKRYAKRKEVKK